VGLIAVAARGHGEGLPDAAARAAGAAVLYARAAGAVVSALGLVLGDRLFQLMTVPPDVARLGHDYLATWLVGGALVFGFFAVEATFRASGDTRTPFLLLAASVLLSVCLDPLLIAGVGPFPRLGVAGAATASVMVRGGGFLIGIGIALHRGLIRFDAPDWATVPTMAQSGDRKSTRLNSSHGSISYAVFCLKKKKKTHTHTIEGSTKVRIAADGNA